MISKEETKELGILCISDFIYDSCKFSNCRWDHSFMREVRECGCCKHALFGICKFGARCRQPHNCKCVEIFRKEIDEIREEYYNFNNQL